MDRLSLCVRWSHSLPPDLLLSRQQHYFAQLVGWLQNDYILVCLATRPVATEEQLSADFRKKLEEWKLKKGVKQPLPVPARQDLSEDFLKKWGEFIIYKHDLS